VRRRPALRTPTASTVTPPSRHTTVPHNKPPRERRPPRPAVRPAVPKPVPRDPRWSPTTAPKRQVARLIDTDDSSLLDVIDNLLNKGVVLNADVVLALANVDLVYLRLSALLCAADRILKSRAP
jgi:hypothetical protein